jgi:hypothetical protein
MKRANDNRRLPWSGALDSVRCTREINSKLATFGFLELPCAIIHETVQCSTGLSGVPSGVIATTPTVDCKSEQWTVPTARIESEQAPDGAPDSEQDLSGGPHVRSSNGRTLTVGWCGWRTGQCPVAHRTVRCAIRQQPSPTATLVVGAINTPNHQHFNASKHSLLLIQYKSNTQHSKT